MQDKAWAHHHWASREPRVSSVCLSWSKPLYLKKSFHSYSSKSSAYLSWFFSQTTRKQGTAHRENAGDGQGWEWKQQGSQSRSSAKTPNRVESRMWLLCPSRRNHWEISNTRREKMDPHLGVNILDRKVRQALRLDCGYGPTHSFQAGTSAECGERKERKIKKENPRWCFSRYLLEMFKPAEYL